MENWPFYNTDSIASSWTCLLLPCLAMATALLGCDVFPDELATQLLTEALGLLLAKLSPMACP